MRIEAFIEDRLDPTILAHHQDTKPVLAVGAGEHPMPVTQLVDDPLDGRTGAERFAAGDAIERLFLLNPAGWRLPGGQIDLRLEADHLFRTGRGAEPALHAKLFGQA